MITPKLMSIFNSIEDELSRAKRKHPDFPSIHHALSVIREEYKELETAAFTDGISRSFLLRDKMRTEALHLATSCVRLLLDEPEAT